MKELLNNYRLNDHTLGFDPRTPNLGSNSNSISRQRLPHGIPTQCTYPSDISNSSHHLINAILLKLVIRSIARFDLDLSAFSLLTDKLDPNWCIRVGNLTQLQMNWNKTDSVNVILRATVCKYGELDDNVSTCTNVLQVIYQTREISVSSGFPNTKKRVENTTCSGVFLTKFEVFG